jgi:iron uptake system EfeUOB component EfeO/EfeM
MARKFDAARKIEKLRETIEILRGKIQRRSGQVKNAESDPKLRGFHHGLRRAQRRIQELTPLTEEQKVKRLEKHLEMVGKRQDELKKQGKKAIDPSMHSVNKIAKSISRRLRRFKRAQEKIKRAEEKAARRAAAALAAAQPAAEAKPAES